MAENAERDLSSSAEKLKRGNGQNQVMAKLRRSMPSVKASSTRSGKKKKGGDQGRTSGSKTSGSRISGDRAASSTGYKKKGYSGSGYSKKSSEDYIRKKQLEEAALNAHGSEDMCEPIYYYIILGLLIFVLTCLSIALIAVSRVDKAEDTYSQARVLSREVHRKQIAILSDNLDCSILMKRFRLYKINVPMSFIAGLMCLSMTEPHSVAPDSAVSYLFFEQQGTKHLARSYENGLLRRWEYCFSLNKSLEIDNSECHAFSFFRITTSYSTHSVKTRIADSALQSYSHFHWRDQFYSQYYKIFNRFSRLTDSGPQPLYPEAAKTNGYSHEEIVNSAVNTVFPVSEQFERFLAKYKPSMRNWNERIFGSSEIDRLKYADTIPVTKEAARHVVNDFLYSNRSRGVLKEKYGEVIIRKGQRDQHIIYPIGAQNSAVISAFIVKVVWEAMKDNLRHFKTLHVFEQEVRFYATVLAAQRYAFQTLPETREWNPKKNKKMLMAFQNRVIRKLKKFEGSKKKPSLNVPPAELVMRKRADRVASLIIWHHSNGDNLAILNLGLPRPFNSSYISGKKTKYPFPSFNSKKMGKSAPFTSASSILVLETPPNREIFDQDKPKVVATASGSLRTVEAVATTVLRTLIFDEESGAAVDAPSAFVSLFDGSFRCEHDRRMSRLRGTFKTVVKILKESYGINCRNVNKKRFEEMDRIAMVVTHSGTSEAYMKASVDDRSKGHNYATGF